MEQLIKDITKMVWNKFLATPKNEHKEMQFSYQNLKNEVGTIVIDYLYAHKNEFNIANVSVSVCDCCNGTGTVPVVNGFMFKDCPKCNAR